MNWQSVLALVTAVVVVALFFMALVGNRKLDRIQRDIAGGMNALHERADREIHERSWVIQGIRSSLEMLRIQIISLFRNDINKDKHE